MKTLNKVMLVTAIVKSVAIKQPTALAVLDIGLAVADATISHKLDPRIPVVAGTAVGFLRAHYLRKNKQVRKELSINAIASIAYVGLEVYKANKA